MLTVREFFNSLSQGKKLTPKSWIDNQNYIHLVDNRIVNQDGKTIDIGDITKYQLYNNKYRPVVGKKLGCIHHQYNYQILQVEPCGSFYAAYVRTNGNLHYGTVRFFNSNGIEINQSHVQVENPVQLVVNESGERRRNAGGNIG